MKVTLNWLKEYVDFDWSAEELTERLTMLGLEVEGVQKIGGEFDGVVVAQVLSKERHPNADKLWLCKVADGAGERQIVCGAQNFQAGDKVPLVLPGATLPAKAGEAPFTIKVGKIRGVESQGMMCSPQELGLPDAVDGLLLLSADATVGQPFAAHLGRSGSDVVYDLEITPNRPDLNSVIGIAREISALTGNPLRVPQPAVASGAIALAGALPGSGIDGQVAVRVEDAELCPRYTARIIRGVKVGPSPDWLRNALEKVGLRSISNVVDVTNFVMLETGQPLHAFDSHLIASGDDGKPTIVVRRAAEGEKFTTIDGQERTLSAEHLLIADSKKGIALAGIMGGQNTEIHEQTVDVLIESACFQPANIRRASKKLELRTDSSYRFERGADIGICDYASRRAVQLILETAGGQLVPGAIDACAKPVVPATVTLRHARVAALLGVEIPVATQNEFLGRLGLERVSDLSDRDDVTTFRIPTFRVDLKSEIDLIEEITRLFGIDKIPATPPRGAIGANAFDGVHDQIAEARRILAGLGLNEAQGQTLISEASARRVSTDLVALENPLSSDMNVLRPSLLPGLLDALQHNLTHQVNDVSLFEIGRVFVRSGEGFAEGRRIAVALTGQRSPAFWSGDNRNANFDVFDLKGVVEEFLEQFGVRGASYVRRSEPTPFWVESAAVQLGKLPLGEIGQLMPSLARQYDLRAPVLVAELNLDQLIARRNAARTFKALPSFPGIRRDVAMLVAEATTHESVLSAVKQAKPAHLEAVELFDVFRGRNVPEGQKSVAYAFTYRNVERTLTDVEVNMAHDKLVEQLKTKLGAAVREG